jgi:pimeloyl-ACP methyl ester carboxylesterase
MLHGWMDVSASFQFVVDELASSWHILAPDWRGFGLSASGPADSYWFPDYLADLDFLIDAIETDGGKPAAPIALLGHSMGGNVAMLYAGVRPQRVRALINLEGFGMRDADPTEAPGRYARWIDELKDPPRLRDYATLADVAARLLQNNPRLTPTRAAFLAEHWSRRVKSGRYELAADPAHRIVNPVGYRSAEAAACWAAIACPVLWVEGADSRATAYAGGVDETARRRALVPALELLRVENAGHMLHHDQPARIAAAIESFVPAG